MCCQSNCCPSSSSAACGSSSNSTGRLRDSIARAAHAVIHRRTGPSKDAVQVHSSASLPVRFQALRAQLSREPTTPETCSDEFFEADRELSIQVLPLRQKGNAALPWNSHFHFASQGLLQSGDDFQQTAFAAAVGADDGSQAGAFELQAERCRQRLSGRAQTSDWQRIMVAPAANCSRQRRRERAGFRHGSRGYGIG